MFYIFWFIQMAIALAGALVHNTSPKPNVFVSFVLGMYVGQATLKLIWGEE